MNHRERMALDRYITREPPEDEDRCPICASREAVKRVAAILEEYGWDVRRRVDGGDGWEDYATATVLDGIEDDTYTICAADGELCDSCAAAERARCEEDARE